jgi:hypothetical protein
MKRLIIVAGFLMVFLSAGVLAQTADNVEKAVRFRATQNNTVVETKTESAGTNSDEQMASAEMISLKHRSSVQVETLYIFSPNTDVTQCVVGWSGDRNTEQLEELGPRYAVGWLGGLNTAQLEELGPRYAVGWLGGDFNTAQLEELGPRYAPGWSIILNTAQLEEPGPPRYVPGWSLLNAAQLEQ